MDQLSNFINEIEGIVAQDIPQSEVVGLVENSLRKLFESDFELPEEYRQASTDTERYARHLVHMAPDKSFSVVAMVWSEGQKSPIHDHNNLWCVECVMEGELEITACNLTEYVDDNHVRFEMSPPIISSAGGTGSFDTSV